MKFCNFLLRVDGIREASLEDFRQVLSKGNRTYKPERQKYLYSIDMEIIDNRYFWMSCDYDDAVRFRDYVINRETGEKEPNPRSKEQIEPRQLYSIMDHIYLQHRGCPLCFSDCLLTFPFRYYTIKMKSGRAYRFRRSRRNRRP